MVGYRCYILDAEDHIVQAHDLDCETDAQAQSAGEGLLARDPYYSSVEIWRATRRVMKFGRATGSAMRPERHAPMTSRELGSVV